MRKLLIRAGFNPLRSYEPVYPLSRNMIGGNSGNLVYAYGVMNVLANQETVFYPTYYKRKWTEEEIDFVNSELDAFVIPLADAFRKDFVPQLRDFTVFIKKLKIPCIVIGCGLRAKYDTTLAESFEFDEDVRQFVSAVLEHSGMFGLRGEITGRYLEKLGFIPEKHFTVTGCPSLYTYGNSVSISELPKSAEHVVMNANALAEDEVQQFLVNSYEAFDNVYLVQQKLRELKYMYLGGEERRVDSIFPQEVFDKMHTENKVKFFLDVPQWIDFMRGKDLFIGNRFHGAVAAILAGVPHVMLPFDARTRELTEYHNITCLKPEEIKEGSTILDYMDKLDFKSFEKSRDKNLMHYVTFLKANGLDNNLSDCLSFPREKSVLENNRFKENAYQISCVQSLGEEERIYRENKYKTDRFEAKDRK